MKKYIFVIISIILFIMFLVYANVFRDFSNPIVVARYYLECIKNREGFLTYGISAPEFFNEDRPGYIYSELRMDKIANINYKIQETKDRIAIVQIEMSYNDRESRILNAELQKSGNIWLLNKIDKI